MIFSKFVTSFRKYLHIGQAVMSLKDAGNVIRNSASSSQTLKLYPDFPAPIPSVITIYAKANGGSIFNKVGETKTGETVFLCNCDDLSSRVK